MRESQLTRCELEIMDVVWRKGRVTVQDVCDGLSRELAYTTVMTNLKTLEEKRRVLRRTKSGRAFVYEPTVTREDIQRQMTGDLTRRLFGGSAKSLVLSLLGQSAISPEEIAEIRHIIDSLGEESR